MHRDPEPQRHAFDATVGERDLWETYLPAFEAGIRDGGATSLMSAYNAVNGIPAPTHVELLQKILREKWGFSGAVVGYVDKVSGMWRPQAHLCHHDHGAEFYRLWSRARPEWISAKNARALRGGSAARRI